MRVICEVLIEMFSIKWKKVRHFPAPISYCLSHPRYFIFFHKHIYLLSTWIPNSSDVSLSLWLQIYFSHMFIIMSYPCSSPLSVSPPFSLPGTLIHPHSALLFACLSFPVFRSLSSARICSLSLTFMFATISQSIPLTLVFTQPLVLPSFLHPHPSAPSLCLSHHCFRLFRWR